MSGLVVIIAGVALLVDVVTAMLNLQPVERQLSISAALPFLHNVAERTRICGGDLRRKH